MNMNQFSFWNPVKIHFGKDSIEQLKKEASAFTRVLIVYGGGSVKKNGVLDAVVNALEGKELYELSGVEPNPRVATARKGIEICKDKNIDLVLAVGGGSVIDCAKLIAAGATVEQDAWDIVTKKVLPQSAVTLGTVLTLAATGSEMNSGSVITNTDTKEKLSWGSPYTFPKFSIMNPEFTFTVPTNQTVNGIVDTMSHIFEQYFHNASNTPITDEMAEGILRTVIEVGPKALAEPDNYEHRETLMLASTMGLNNFLGLGSRGDWATHNIEHAVSAYYDIAHAEGLSILFPNWMKHNLKVDPQRFAKLATKVFGVDTANKTDEQVGLEGIERLSQFWTSIGAPSTLTQVGIDNSQFDDMVQHAMIYGPFGNFTKLQADDVRAILNMSL